jgi:hypothetical protein
MKQIQNVRLAPALLVEHFGQIEAHEHRSGTECHPWAY